MKFKMVRYCVMVVAYLFLFTACLRPAPVIHPSRAGKFSSEETLKALQENSPQVIFFKSKFKARIEYPLENKNKKHSFEGALLYRKENRTIRLQAFGTFGNTIFDMIYRPDQTLIFLPSSAVVYTGAPALLINSRIPDFFFFLQEIMNRMEEKYEGQPQWITSETIKTKKENVEYLFKVNKQYLFIDEKTILRDGETIAQIVYQDYKQVKANIFPITVKAFFPATKTTIHITLDSPVINEPMPEKAFFLSLPPEIRYLPLSKLNNLFPADPS